MQCTWAYSQVASAARLMQVPTSLDVRRNSMRRHMREGERDVTDHDAVWRGREPAQGKVCYVSVQISETGPLFARDLAVNKGEILTLATTPPRADSEQADDCEPVLGL